jgi:hypothetical protein
MARPREPERYMKIYAHVLGEEQDVAAIARLDAIDVSRGIDAGPQQGPGDPARGIGGPSI